MGLGLQQGGMGGGSFEVITVPDFAGRKRNIFAARTILFLASWIENAGAARQLPIHVACIGEPPGKVREMADRVGAIVSVHEPLRLASVFSANKLRGLEVERRTRRYLLLDTDIVFLGDISRLAELPDCIALAPASKVKVRPNHWNRLYAEADLPFPAERMPLLSWELDMPDVPDGRKRFAPKSFEGAESPPYYNGGVVFGCWEHGLRSAWAECIELGFNAVGGAERGARGVHCSDQAGLAMAVARLRAKGIEFRRLPDAMNVRWRQPCAVCTRGHASSPHDRDDERRRLWRRVLLGPPGAAPGVVRSDSVETLFAVVEGPAPRPAVHWSWAFPVGAGSYEAATAPTHADLPEPDPDGMMERTFANQLLTRIRPDSPYRRVQRDLNTLCLFLGPYRNLTTLTASILHLHPNCQVLNHAGEHVLRSERLNFFEGYNDEKFWRFCRYALLKSQAGHRGDAGGSVTLSHAFADHPIMSETFRERYGDRRLKDRVHSTVWKESNRTHNYLHQQEHLLPDLLGKNPYLRFLLPIRNPFDCAESNFRRKHSRYIRGIDRTNPNDVLTGILGMFAWFIEQSERFPDRFFYFFQDEVDDDMLRRLAAFLGLAQDARWIEDSKRCFQLKPSHEGREPSLIETYTSEVDRLFAAAPDFRAKLLAFV